MFLTIIEPKTMTQLLLRSIPQTKQCSSCDKLQTSMRGLFISDPEFESENKNKMCLLVLGTIRIFAPSPLMQNTPSRIMFPDQVRLPLIPNPPFSSHQMRIKVENKMLTNTSPWLIIYIYYQFLRKVNTGYFKVVVSGQNI